MKTSEVHQMSQISSAAASSLIKATVSSLPCAGLCPSCGVSQARVYECGYLGACDHCLDVLLGVAELPGRVSVSRFDADSDDDAATQPEEVTDDVDDHDNEPVAETSPSHTALATIDLHTQDGFEICEHCGAATKHHCSAGHVVCLGCMAAHDGCPLCIEAEGGVGDGEDLSYLDC